MRIIQNENRVILLDSLTGIWIFFLMFILAGSFAVACPLGLCANTAIPFGVKELSLALGLIFIFFGLISIWRHPFTRTEINYKTCLVTVRQGRSTVSLKPAEIRDVKVLSKEGTEGRGCKLHFELTNGKLIPLSSWWAAHPQNLLQSAEVLRKALEKMK